MSDPKTRLTNVGDYLIIRTHLQVPDPVLDDWQPLDILIGENIRSGKS